MKKVVSIITIASISLLACNKVAVMPEISEENSTETQEVSTPSYHTVTLNAAINPEVKSAYDPTDNVTFSWSAYDQISVLFHKGDDNKFFPLTTTTGGSNSATFSGSIEDGWELGSNEATPRYWALFPASDNHTYTKDAANPITFHIPATTDYTAGEHPHYSADVPMAAEWDGSGGSTSFTMALLSGAYKFTFTGITASKVKLEVYNQGSSTKSLSGNIPVSYSTSNYLNAEISGGSRTVSYIRNTVGGEAVFYIPYQVGSDFQPKLTLFNMDAGEKNGYTIYSTTSKARLPSVSSYKVVVVPAKDLSSYGAGMPFWSAYKVNWAGATMVADGDTNVDQDALKGFKAVASTDGTKLYLLFELDATKLHDIPTADYSNKITWYLYSGTSGSGWSYWSEHDFNQYIDFWAKKSNVVSMTEWNDNISSNFVQLGDIIYCEQEVLRSGYTSLQGTNCKIGLTVNTKVNNDSSILEENIGLAPAKNSAMLSVVMPTYVAP